MRLLRAPDTTDGGAPAAPHRTKIALVGTEQTWPPAPFMFEADTVAATIAPPVAF